jgi:hypothetical protein
MPVLRNPRKELYLKKTIRDCLDSRLMFIPNGSSGTHRRSKLQILQEFFFESVD